MKNDMIRVADYIANRLAELGARQVFMVTGGGAMHLNDAFGRQKELNVVHCHHEQACAMAADSYFRVAGRPAVVNVTTGPGGTNAITGVYGAYTDSVGMVVVSGQVKWETLVRSTGLKLRQLGDQEIDIIEIVKPITKLAEVLEDPKLVRYQLEKAYHTAVSGRPGPVWLDVPMNVQGALVNPDDLVDYTPPPVAHQPAAVELEGLCRQMLTKLSEAKRPVIMVGGGVRISGAYDNFLKVIDHLGIPVVTCWNAHDAVWNSHPLYAGRPGTIGDRPGNFAVQNADFVLVLGSRLNIRQVSYNWKSFARHAYKVMVDVDELELKKPTLSIDLPIHAHLKDFFATVLRLKVAVPPAHKEYVQWCKVRLEKYPVVLKEYWNLKENVNPYCFAWTLTELLPENELTVTGDGTACVVTFQSALVKKGQRLFTNSGCASMGFDLPAAIGAWCASRGERLVCIAGDGSIMMNLQELQTIRHHKMPVKLFVLNNRGYHSIRQTQHNYFPDNIVGCGTESGLSFPDFKDVAATFGFHFERITDQKDLKGQIKKALDQSGPVLCEVFLDLDQQFSPKLSSRKLADGRMISASLEDMSPFLSREELAENLLIPLPQEL